MLTIEDIDRANITSTVPFTWNDPRMTKINAELADLKGY